MKKYLLTNFGDHGITGANVDDFIENNVKVHTINRMALERVQNYLDKYINIDDVEASAEDLLFLTQIQDDLNSQLKEGERKYKLIDMYRAFIVAGGLQNARMHPMLRAATPSTVLVEAGLDFDALKADIRNSPIKGRIRAFEHNLYRLMQQKEFKKSARGIHKVGVVLHNMFVNKHSNKIETLANGINVGKALLNPDKVLGAMNKEEKRSELMKKLGKTKAGSAYDSTKETTLNMAAAFAGGTIQGFGANILMQTILYHLIQSVAELAQNELFVENLENVKDLNGDGDYDDPGESGHIVETYRVDHDEAAVNKANNKTRYEMGLQMSRLVFVTDYVELGPNGIDEGWEFVNGYLSGMQIFHAMCGMDFINAQNMTQVKMAQHNLKQIRGDISLGTNFIAPGPHEERAWQVGCTVAGAAISVVTEIVSGAIRGALTAGPAGVVGGAILGAGKALVQGLIGLGQSFAAGKVVDAGWEGAMNGHVANTWKNALHVPWTESLKGDKDGLIWMYEKMSWFYDVGQNFQWQVFRWLYINQYVDYGVYAGPFDSALMPLAYLGIAFGIVMPILLAIPGVGWIAAIAVAIATFFAFIILQFLGTMIHRLLILLGIRNDPDLPDKYRGDPT